MNGLPHLKTSREHCLMARNFDLSALRAFVTVAELGGVTKAAGALHLTQSAVSLQLKRLEESLGVPLLERSSRGVSLTTAGVRFMDDARGLLALNDAAWERMTDRCDGGEIALAVPEDLLYPHVPEAMRMFERVAPDWPVRLWTGLSADMKAQYRDGVIDVLLVTERQPDADATILHRLPLLWMGARGGTAWQRRPFPLGTVEGCAFTRPAVEALNASSTDWTMALAAAHTQAVEASMLADQVVHMQLEGTIDGRFEAVPHGGTLPKLPHFAVALYVTEGRHRVPSARLAMCLRETFARAQSVNAA